MKITKNVSFNIASEASYVYILSGQKFIQNAKNGRFWQVFGKTCGQIVLPDRSLLKDKNWCKTPKIQFLRFWKPEAGSQTALPDRSILLGE